MSSGEISIPFVSYERAFDLEQSVDYCSLYISQLTNIRDTTTETNLRMRVYGWFENIKVFGASHHANVSSTYLKNKIAEYNRIIDAQIQINTRNEQPGVVSTVASGVSKIAGALSGVPVVGSIAGSVGWLSDIVSNVASVFGFSRPTSIKENIRVSNIPGHGYLCYRCR